MTAETACPSHSGEYGISRYLGDFDIMTAIMIPITTEDESIHPITERLRITTHTATGTEQTVLTERP